MTIIYKTRIALVSLFAASSVALQAADFRIWTSTKGSTMEAQLTSYDEGKVNLTTKEEKSIKLKAVDLSLADRQYLVEFANAKEETVYKSSSVVPEEQYRKPKDFIEKLEESMMLDGTELVFELYKTEHFIFACSKGINPRGIAETAEACWYGMAFEHFEFRENFGTTKLLVILPEDEEVYKSVGEYNVAEMNKVGKTAQANQALETWDRATSNQVFINDTLMDRHNIKEYAQIFKTKDSKDYRKDFVPFQTHVISKALFTEQVGGVKGIKGSGYFALYTGHAYYKEILLAKKTQTSLISKDYEVGLGSKSGFKDGTSWAKDLRKLVKKEDVNPDIVELLAIKTSNELDPNRLVTMYALSYYLQSTQKRIASYAKLVRVIHSTDKMPEPLEIAEIYGFESVDALQADWIEFIKSKDFK